MSEHKPSFDLSNQRFGKLLVAGFSHYRKQKSFWFVVCDCGTRKTANGTDLKMGKIASCGCTRREKPPGLKHGQRYSGAYQSWCAMKARCENPKNAHFAGYGGRGVTVCARWMDFERFLEDMGERPKGMSIERVDTNGNYEPSNCHWATQKEQMSNTRANVEVTYNGETHTVQQWAELTGINHSTIRKRLTAGWSTEDVFRKPSFRPRSKNAIRD